MAILFEELPKWMDQYKVAMFKAVDEVVQKAALTGGEYLARETPVDTGVARSNWVLTLGMPFDIVIPAYFPYPSYRNNHHEAVKQVALSGAFGKRTGARSGGSFNPRGFNGRP